MHNDPQQPQRPEPQQASSSSAAPPLSAGQRLAAKYPNAHKILSDLHLMKRLNQELFLQLDAARVEAIRCSDALHSIGSSAAIDTLRGVLEERDKTTVQSCSNSAPAVAAAPTSESSQSMRHKFLQLVDDAVEKAKSVPSAAAGGLQSLSSSSVPFAQYDKAVKELEAVRLKVVASESAQKQLAMCRAWLDESREELKQLRRALAEADSQRTELLRERNQWKAALVERLESSAATTATDGDALVQREGNDAKMTEVVTNGLERRVDSIFDDIFGQQGDEANHTQPSPHPAHAALPSDAAVLAELVVSNARLDSEKSAALATLQALQSDVTCVLLELEGVNGVARVLQDENKELTLSVRTLEARLKKEVEASELLKRRNTECASTVEKLRLDVAKFATVEGALRAASKDSEDLSLEVCNLGTRVTALTTERDSLRREKEQREREVLALQRMLNCVELVQEDGPLRPRASVVHSSPPNVAHVGEASAAREELEETCRRLRAMCKEERQKHAHELEAMKANFAVRMMKRRFAEDFCVTMHFLQQLAALQMRNMFLELALSQRNDTGNSATDEVHNGREASALPQVNCNPIKTSDALQLEVVTTSNRSTSQANQDMTSVMGECSECCRLQEELAVGKSERRALLRTVEELQCTIRAQGESVLGSGPLASSGTQTMDVDDSPHDANVAKSRAAERRDLPIESRGDELKSHKGTAKEIQRDRKTRTDFQQGRRGAPPVAGVALRPAGGGLVSSMLSSIHNGIGRYHRRDGAEEVLTGAQVRNLQRLLEEQILKGIQLEEELGRLRGDGQ